MNRLGVWLALLACWFVGCVLGTMGVALRTEAGRNLVGRAAVSFINDRINGTLSIGELGGSFVEGLEARDIVLRGPDGSPIFELRRLRLRYRLADLLSRRIVLGQLILDQPQVTFTRSRPGEPFDFELLLPADSGRIRGSPLFVAFGDVQITDGSFVVRTPTGSTDSGVVEGDFGPESALHVRRIDGINAEFPYLRLASPRPSERGIRSEIASLEARISDPAPQYISATHGWAARE
jgi:hypothetical protein